MPLNFQTQVTQTNNIDNANTTVSNILVTITNGSIDDNGNDNSDGDCNNGNDNGNGYVDNGAKDNDYSSDKNI